MHIQHVVCHYRNAINLSPIVEVHIRNSNSEIEAIRLHRRSLERATTLRFEGNRQRDRYEKLACQENYAELHAVIPAGRNYPRKTPLSATRHPLIPPSDNSPSRWVNRVRVRVGNLFIMPKNAEDVDMPGYL